MKGVIVASPNAPFEVVADVEKPTPSETQILVQSRYTGINPVYEPWSACDLIQLLNRKC
jgi:NADPH:quinone reductase-like Zn-dependent oxidoreductase